MPRENQPGLKIEGRILLFNNSLREVQGFMYNFGLPKSALVVGCCASILIAGGCASKTDFYVLQDDVQELQKRSLDSGGHRQRFMLK